MGVLTKKLSRTIWHTRGQFLAVVAVVMVGISVYIAMSTAYYNLNHSKELFYRENNFADYYFQVIKAPSQVVKQIESVPGVTQVTGRIYRDVSLIKENDQRATVRLISYHLPMEREVNRLQLLSGRLFNKYPQAGGVEVLSDPQFFRGNALAFNDTLTIVAEGRRVPLTVVGTAISPELIYPMKDASTLVPDPKTFGIIMLPQNQAQQILNLSGQINQVVIKLSPGADENEVKERVETILKPYGNLASYPRKQQLSNAILQHELDSLQASSLFLPAIFLGIAAAIQLVMLSRMIKTQRLQIGVMKALGYNSRQIIVHYTGYALTVAFAGALLGSLLGLLLASVISQAYAKYFNLPADIGGVNLQAITYGFIISLGVGILAGVSASRGVIKIQPAESMRPEPPKKGGRIFLEQWERMWQKLDTTWKMSLRTVFRNRGRFGVTLVGVIFAVGMLVVALFARDSIDYMLKEHFYREQQYDYLIGFANPVKENELLNISRLEGVQKVEPLLEIPVKIHFRGKSEDDLLVGLPRNVTLKKLTNNTGQPLPLPQDGILIHERTARKLGVQRGDLVTVETLLGKGISREARVKIAGVNGQLIGSGSYIDLEQANRIIQEKQLVSGTMLKVDPGKGDALEDKLNQMTGIAFILSRQKELNNFNQNLDSLIYSISVMVAFALVLGFAIVYNSSVISFAERKKELASLRVVGFTSREVSGLMLKEIMLQSLLGVLLGLPFGRLMAQGYVNSVSTDLFTLPVMVYPATYLYSALGGMFFIMVAHLFAVRGIKQLDLVEVLKNKD